MIKLEISVRDNTKTTHWDRSVDSPYTLREGDTVQLNRWEDDEGRVDEDGETVRVILYGTVTRSRMDFDGSWVVAFQHYVIDPEDSDPDGRANGWWSEDGDINYLLRRSGWSGFEVAHGENGDD